MHELFPSIPIMALTATLLADQSEELVKHYLNTPVVIKSTVNRPNIKLCVGDYDFRMEKMTGKQTTAAEDDRKSNAENECDKENPEVQATTHVPNDDKTTNKNGNDHT